MILIISVCKEKFHELEFVKPIEDILESNKVKLFTKHYKNISSSDLKKAEKVIICGTSLADNEFLKHIASFQWLKSFKKPVLGICAGSHVIGLILGYKIKKQKKATIGFKKINLSKKFLGVQGTIDSYHLNQFNVLPETFHKDNFYATLFHPEVRNKQIIVNFCKDF